MNENQQTDSELNNLNKPLKIPVPTPPPPPVPTTPHQTTIPTSEKQLLIITNIIILILVVILILKFLFFLLSNDYRITLPSSVTENNSTSTTNEVDVLNKNTPTSTPALNTNYTDNQIDSRKHAAEVFMKFLEKTVQGFDMNKYSQCYTLSNGDFYYTHVFITDSSNTESPFDLTEALTNVFRDAYMRADLVSTLEKKGLTIEQVPLEYYPKVDPCIIINSIINEKQNPAN